MTALPRPGTGEPVRTWANGMTVIRTAVAVPLGLLAVVRASPGLLVTAYACYWIGDVLDGWLARRLNQETRIGAVLDIISDRACCGVLVCGLAVTQPTMGPALAVFLLQFMVLDCVLSLSFLRWPLLSPNYFHQVDRTVWLVNWSPPAKAVNTVTVVIAVLSHHPALALAVAVAQLGLKIWSARRVLALPVDDPGAVLPARSQAR
jgi:phosphatidylglycerophosphate synthase